jgi:hypothetical protein
MNFCFYEEQLNKLTSNIFITKLAMRSDVLYIIILLCLTPDGFTRHGESTATQWAN